jgi:hypothetical protein
VFTGGVFTGGVFTGGASTGGVFTGGVFTGGVFTGGVFTGAVTGGVAPAAVSEVSDGVLDVTSVAAVEGVVAEALGQTTAKAAPSAASRAASQRRPKRWLSRGLNTTGKLPPQIARTPQCAGAFASRCSPAPFPGTTGLSNPDYHIDSGSRRTNYLIPGRAGGQARAATGAFALSWITAARAGNDDLTPGAGDEKVGRTAADRPLPLRWACSLAWTRSLDWPQQH